VSQTTTCAANDKGRACPRSADVLQPVALCDAHRIEVALAVVPDMLRSQLAVAEAHKVNGADARDDLVVTAAATPVDRLLRGEHDSVVYFIANGGRVKIGRTTNLKSRVSALSLRVDSVLLALSGGSELERALHVRFSEYRDGDTEWFELSPEIFRYASVRNAVISAVTPLPSVQVATGPSAAVHARREQRKTRAFRVYEDLGHPSQRSFIRTWRELGYGESDQTLRELYDQMHAAFENARKGTTD
jgi:hypothetical protein